MCDQFVNKGQTPKLYVFFVLFQAFIASDGYVISIQRCMCVDILILAYRLLSIIFSAPITRGNDNYLNVNKGLG